MPKLILDVMGGDHAPHANLEGASKAWPELSKLGADLVLVGDEQVIRPLLADKSRREYRELAEAVASGQVSILHAPQNIDMEDSIRAIRSKPDASINVGCRLAAQAYEATAKNKGASRTDTAHDSAAFISAGHSGAVMASALLNMGRLPHVERPAIAARVPTLSPDGCVIVDAGANVECKPENLRDFAVMGGFYAQVGRKQPGLPKIGVLSNGEERKKGTELTRAARDLIEKHPAFSQTFDEPAGNVMGYCEGKEIFRGQVDVVVTDGFLGNAMLKVVEGLGSAIITLIKTEAKRGILAPLGFLISSAAFRRIRKKLDWTEYGGAPLLGVAGYAFICHGRSNSKSIMNALLRAHSALEGRMIERLESALTRANQERASGQESKKDSGKKASHPDLSQ